MAHGVTLSVLEKALGSRADNILFKYLGACAVLRILDAVSYAEADSALHPLHTSFS